MKTIFCDLDGIIIRRYAKRPQMADQKALSEAMALLANLTERPRVIFVTDRPAGGIPPFVWMFHGDRFHAGESGAVLFDRDRNVEIPFCKYLQYTNFIRKNIVRHLSGVVGRENFNEEPGGKQVIISLETPPGFPNFANIIVDACLGHSWTNEIRIESQGSAISIHPRDLNKCFGFRRIKMAYEEIGDPIDFSQSYWIADGNRDISFGELILEQGGTVCGVGNSDEEYANFVRNSGGILGSGCYEAGLLQILQKALC